MSGWSMVWFAPVWRSSGGRSAVSRIIGTPSVDASTTAGRPLATAVPEVVIQAAGPPVARACPRAAKAVPRSSKWIRLRSFSFAASAATRGVEREPGATQKKPTPQRRSSSTIRYAQRRLARDVSLFKPEHPGEVADLLFDLGPLLIRHGAGDDPGPRKEGERLSPHEPRANTDGELGVFGPDPADRTGVPAPIEGFEGVYVLQRPTSRIPADGGRRMHCVEQCGVGHTILERPPDLRPKVPSPCQLHLRDVVLDLQLFTERLQRLPYTFAHVSVLGEVFGAVQQVVAQAFIVSRRYATGPGPCHSLALHRASVAAEQALGRGPEKRRTILGLYVEVEAARCGPLQALEQKRGIQVPVETELCPAGKHDLPKAPFRKRPESPPDVLPPALQVRSVLPEYGCRQ